MEMHHKTMFTLGLTWRKLVEGEVARVFHKMAWLLTPRHIPNEAIGNRRRNGHFLSSGSINSSDGCIENDQQIITHHNIKICPGKLTS